MHRIIRHKKPVPSYWIPYFTSECFYQEGEPEIEDEWFELNPEQLCYLFSEDFCGPNDESANRVREYLDNPDKYIVEEVRRLTGMTPEDWFVDECRVHISDLLVDKIKRYWFYLHRELKGE